MLPLLLLLLLLLLAACAPARTGSAIQLFDLGGAHRANAPSVPLRGVDVVAPSWLETSAMQYRLAYVDAAGRRSYAESRWVASPRELLEESLSRSLVPAEGGALSGCLLRVDLDEFIHRFSGFAQSAGVIELRAAVLAPRSDRMLARRAFRAEVPAPSADARGGVRALSEGAGQVAAELAAWLSALDRDGDGGLNIARACRSE